MTTADPENEIRLFNSWLETGIRALVVLNAAHPMMFDLAQLTWFDHLVVHTGDIGGPKSLHPDLPHRSGELLIRRAIIEHSLILMRRLHLIEVVAQNNGILYRASEEANSFIELMRTPYARNLNERANWLAENICSLDPASIEKLIDERMGRWSVEFQSNTHPSRRLF